MIRKRSIERKMNLQEYELHGNGYWNAGVLTKVLVAGSCIFASTGIHDRRNIEGVGYCTFADQSWYPRGFLGQGNGFESSLFVEFWCCRTILEILVPDALKVKRRVHTCCYKFARWMGEMKCLLMMLGACHDSWWRPVQSRRIVFQTKK